MKIDIKLTGDKEIAAKFKALAGKSIKELERAVTESAVYVEGEAKEKAPVLTNRLRSSITHKVNKTTQGVQGRVGTNVDYAASQEFGTVPHFAPISARAAKKYGFGNKDTVIWVSGEAHPFLIPALKEARGWIIKAIKRAFKRLKL